MLVEKNVSFMSWGDATAQPTRGALRMGAWDQSSSYIDFPSRMFDGVCRPPGLDSKHISNGPSRPARRVWMRIGSSCRKKAVRTWQGEGILFEHQPHARGEVKRIGDAPGSVGRGGALQSEIQGGDGGLVLGGHGCAPQARAAGNGVGEEGRRVSKESRFPSLISIARLPRSLACDRQRAAAATTHTRVLGQGSSETKTGNRGIEQGRNTRPGCDGGGSL